MLRQVLIRSRPSILAKTCPNCRICIRSISLSPTSLAEKKTAGSRQSLQSIDGVSWSPEFVPDDVYDLPAAGISEIESMSDLRDLYRKIAYELPQLSGMA